MFTEADMKQRIERIKMVKAMEYIARTLNDEDIFDSWLLLGVADGVIPEGELDVKADDIDILDYYTAPENFKDLMRLFLRLMYRAYDEDSGLFHTGIVGGKI